MKTTRTLLVLLLTVTGAAGVDHSQADETAYIGCSQKDGILAYILSLNRGDELQEFVLATALRGKRGEISKEEVAQLLRKKLCEIVGPHPYESKMRQYWPQLFASSAPEFVELQQYALSIARVTDSSALAWPDADKLIEEKRLEINQNMHQEPSSASPNTAASQPAPQSALSVEQCVDRCIAIEYNHLVEIARQKSDPDQFRVALEEFDKPYAKAMLQNRCKEQCYR